MQVKKQQLEPDMEQLTGFTLGKEYIKAVYCHHAYLTSTQSTSWEMLDWRKHKLESRLQGETSIKAETLFYQKGASSQGYGFSSSHEWMWELDCQENWALKNWCFWTVVLEKTLESPLDCKEIQPVHPKRDQSWVFFGRTDAKVETPVL